MFNEKFKLPAEPMRVPGELLIKLHHKAHLNIATSIPAGPTRRVPYTLPTKFGLEELDKKMEQYEVASISRIHGPIPQRKSAEKKDKNIEKLQQSLEATYRVKFQKMDVNLDKVAKQLTASKAVAQVDFNYYEFLQMVPDDPQFGMQWGLSKIRCPEAWDIEIGKPSVVVAVVDSGVDLNHPDLAANLLAGRDFVDLTSFGSMPGDTLTINGEDFVMEGDVLTIDNDPQDEVGHGTHVAGTIAALTNNTIGVAGVAGGCRILPIRSMFRARRLRDGFITGVGTTVDIAAGIRWSADNGADVINLSLGSYAVSMVREDAINYALAANVVVVAAMGNENTAMPSFPASYPGVIAVGAVDASDNRAWFSNFGPHIAVVAPGVNIRSTDWDDAYSTKDGTSMACPHVAGLAALILSCNPALTNVEVADIIKDTAVPLKDNPADPIPNNNYGFGRIDARSALDRCMPKVKEIKEIKELKEGPKEIKEFKEGKELKEFKEGKELKEFPKEDIKEFKEFKELPKETAKELKEIPKEWVEKSPIEQKHRETKVTDVPFPGGINPGVINPGTIANPGDGFQQVLQQLRLIEKMLGQGQAFISQSERPNVGDKISEA